MLDNDRVIINDYDDFGGISSACAVLNIQTTNNINARIIISSVRQSELLPTLKKLNLLLFQNARWFLP